MSAVSKTDIIEALLFASDAPLPLSKLAHIAELDEDSALREIDVLREEKSRIGALQIIESAGGWQIVTKPQFASHIRSLRDVPKQKLSRAAFEVMAIVAYRQPVTRGEIEALRSVDCASALQLLIERKLIIFAGRKDAPGRPWLYATSPLFLEQFGLRDLGDLPSLSEWNALHQEAQASSLFNRGAMQPSSETVDAALESADESAVQVLADNETSSGSSEYESGKEAPVEDAHHGD